MIYIEGFRGTVSATSAGSIGTLNPSGITNFYKADAVPTKGTTSAMVALRVWTDLTWGWQPTSGTAYPILWASLTSYGATFGDAWTAT